jgi:hypothetical protein
MIETIRSIEDARRYRYGKSAGYAGTAYREGFCAEEVASSGRAIHFYQCQRKRSGESLFCHQHGPVAAAKRETASRVRYERQVNNLPSVRAARYREALEAIASRPAITPVADVKFMREIAWKALEE